MAWLTNMSTADSIIFAKCVQEIMNDSLVIGYYLNIVFEGDDVFEFKISF